MLLYPASHRRIHLGLALLTLVATVLANLPPHPAGAAATIGDAELSSSGGLISIGDTVGEFSSGTYYRTALDGTDGDDSAGDDLPGAVRLTRSGSLKSWGAAANPLPAAASLAKASVVALGTRVYALGGITGDQDASSSTRFSDKIYWTSINPDTGAPSDPNSGGAVWATQDMPLSKHSNVTIGLGGAVNCTAQTGAVGRMASAAYSPGNNNTGVIYLMGGTIACQSNPVRTVASYAVKVGTVGDNGAITWVDGPRLPPSETESHKAEGSFDGLQDASAVVVPVGGKLFLYVIGGRRSDFQGASQLYAEAYFGSHKVYFVELDPATGAIKDSAWKTATQEIPTPKVTDGSTGLWNASAFPASFDLGGGGLTSGQTIFVVGGQQKIAGTLDTSYNLVLFKATPDATGELTWSDNAGKGLNGQPSKVSLPGRRVNMAGFSAFGKIYLGGGLEPNDLVSNQGTFIGAVLNTTFQDDLTITTSGGSPFGGIDNNNIFAALEPNGIAIVRSNPEVSRPNTAWAIVVGGRATSGRPSNQVFSGQIGSVDESDSAAIAESGWFLSERRPITANISGLSDDAKVGVQEILWSGEIDRAAASSMDIIFQYRMGIAPASTLCNNPDVFSNELFNPQSGANPSGWREASKDPADSNFFSAAGSGDKKISINKRRIDRVEANCFQYRAKLLTNRGATSGPALLHVKITAVFPGRPDIRIAKDNNGNERFKATQNPTTGDLTGFELVIENKHERSIDSPVQSSDFAKRVFNETGGSFFIDMCISRVNSTVTKPSQPYEGAVVCTNGYHLNTSIDRLNLGANAQFTVPSNSWYASFTDGIGTGGQPVNLSDYFKEKGIYEVYVVLDTSEQPIGAECPWQLSCVDEGKNGGELNNVSGLLKVTIGTPPPPKVYLPVVYR